jgi:hypothetical protein
METLVCSGCGNTLHRECWDSLGGCSVKGCPKAVEVGKAEIVLTDWGKTDKTCPFCAEQIPVAARTCPFCNASFGDYRPMTKEDVLPRAEDQEIRATQSKAKLLLVFSLLGFTSPFALLIGGIWYSESKNAIARAGANTRALVLVALGICVLYVVMAVLGTLVFSLKPHPA